MSETKKVRCWHDHAPSKALGKSPLWPLLCFWVFVQSLSHVQLFATSWTAACQASLSFTISWILLKLMCLESVMPSNHLILCHPLFLLPSIFPSVRVFSNESALRIRQPKYWSFSFSISLSNEQSGLISFRIDWFDLLAVQGTLKSLLQQHSLKASILQHSAFFAGNPQQSLGCGCIHHSSLRLSSHDLLSCQYGCESPNLSLCMRTPVIGFRGSP